MTSMTKRLNIDPGVYVTEITSPVACFSPKSPKSPSTIEDALPDFQPPKRYVKPEEKQNKGPGVIIMVCIWVKVILCMEWHLTLSVLNVPIIDWEWCRQIIDDFHIQICWHSKLKLCGVVVMSAHCSLCYKHVGTVTLPCVMQS